MLIKILFNFPVGAFFNKGRQTYEKSFIKLSTLRHKTKHFHQFLTQNNLQIFVIYTNFVKVLISDTHKKLLRIYAQLFLNFHLKQFTKNLALHTRVI